MPRTLPVLPLALLLAAPAALAKRPAHPAVGADVAPDACVTCHAEKTPKVVAAWESGKHGLLLVKCFVCHGSTGRDFALRPAAARCQGCHPAEAAAIVPAKATAAARRAKAGDCFPCHEPHTLAPREGAANPHGAPAR